MDIAMFVRTFYGRWCSKKLNFRARFECSVVVFRINYFFRNQTLIQTVLRTLSLQLKTETLKFWTCLMLKVKYFEPGISGARCLKTSQPDNILTVT